MASQTRVEFDLSEAEALFQALSLKIGDLTPFMNDVGQILVDSTIQRFQQGIAPDGTAWAPNSPSTLARKKGTQPLIGKTRILSTQISHQASPTGVEWGSNLIYAAVHQLGAGKGVFGPMSNGSPIPWGNIPPRPFLGISETDRIMIIEEGEEYLDDD